MFTVFWGENLERTREFANFVRTGRDTRMGGRVQKRPPSVSPMIVHEQLKLGMVWSFFREPRPEWGVIRINRAHRNPRLFLTLN